MTKLVVPTSIDGLTNQENELLAELAEVWTRHASRNRKLTAYYESKEPLVDFGLTVPQSIKDHYTPLGWARKAVDMLAELCVFEGFVSPGVDDPFQLQDFMSRIGFTSVLQQAIQTALIHGCSFLSVIQDAENRPLIRTHTAESSAAIWDYPNRRVKACMAITDVNNDNEVIGLVLYMPTRNISVSRSLGTWYVQGSQPTVNGECSVFRLAYKATEVKPFGRSRISHDAMNIIDGANRTIVRAEANAEFYAFPKILLMGTSDELASLSADAALKLYMGRYNMISKDADGDSPTVTQLAASSMDPHLTMLKSWAAMFASAMNIPASSLGIVSDANPTSADATEAQREDLIIEARHCDRDFGESILQAARLVARIQDTSVSDDDLMKLQVDWKNPNTPSSSMSADAFSKLAGSIDSFANSEVGMTRAGLSRSEIVRLKADQRKAQAGQVLDQIRGMRQQTEQTQDDGERQNDTSTQSTVAGGVKDSFDALGVAIRAGVTPESAASMLGLKGIEFTGMTPVSLKLPEGGGNEPEQSEPASGTTQKA
ncbi:phage portal protein [Bifidobacterium merycicum]